MGKGEEGITHPSVCIEIRLSQNSSGFSVRFERANGLETSEAAAEKDTHAGVSILNELFDIVVVVFQ